MYYILILDGKAHESIPEYNPVFPDIPVEERYAPDFLARCVRSETEVPQGHIYNPDTGTFSAPPEDENTGKY